MVLWPMLLPDLTQNKEGPSILRDHSQNPIFLEIDWDTSFSHAEKYFSEAFHQQISIIPKTIGVKYLSKSFDIGHQ